MYNIVRRKLLQRLINIMVSSGGGGGGGGGAGSGGRRLRNAARGLDWERSRSVMERWIKKLRRSGYPVELITFVTIIAN